MLLRHFYCNNMTMITDSFVFFLSAIDSIFACSLFIIKNKLLINTKGLKKYSNYYINKIVLSHLNKNSKGCL